MTTIESTQPSSPAAVNAARVALDQVKARIDDVLAEREGLLAECRTALEAAGHTVVVMRKTFQKPPSLDAHWRVWETYEYIRETVHHRDIYRISTSHGWHWGVGAGTWERSMYIDQGPYRLVLADKCLTSRYGADEYDLLLVKEPDAATETGHRLSVGRLRTLARHDDLRVQVRDRDIRLIDPLNHEVHAGDIVSAFAFLLNLDLENARAW